MLATMRTCGLVRDRPNRKSGNRWLLLTDTSRIWAGIRRHLLLVSWRGRRRGAKPSWQCFRGKERGAQVVSFVVAKTPFSYTGIMSRRAKAIVGSVFKSNYIYIQLEGAGSRSRLCHRYHCAYGGPVFNNFYDAAASALFPFSAFRFEYQQTSLKQTAA